MGRTTGYRETRAEGKVIQVAERKKTGGRWYGGTALSPKVPSSLYSLVQLGGALCPSCSCSSVLANLFHPSPPTLLPGGSPGF